MSKKWLTLITVCFGLFMSLLNVTMINVGIPTIQQELHAGIDKLEWIINSYTLIFAVFLITASRLGDICGRKTIYIAGLFIFTIGSLLCGLSNNINLLIVSRGIQGLGAAAMMSLSLSIIATTFTGKERGIAIGIWGGLSGLATGIGPLIGGLLVKYACWNIMFLLNAPIGIIGIILSFWAIQQSKDDNLNNKIDILGFIFCTTFVSCLIFGMIKANEVDYSLFSPLIIALFTASIIALVAFIIWELKSENPMINLKIFKSSNFTSSIIASFCLNIGIYGLFFFISMYLQNSLGLDALQTGSCLLAYTVPLFIIATISGFLTAKTGVKPILVISLFMVGVGDLLMARIYIHSGLSILLPGLIIAGIGAGFLHPTISDLAVGSVCKNYTGMASGICSVSAELGSTFGIVFFSTILANHYASAITEGSVSNILIVGACVLVVGALLCTILVKKKSST